jgi:hypothetical protein
MKWNGAHNHRIGCTCMLCNRIRGGVGLRRRRMHRVRQHERTAPARFTFPHVERGIRAIVAREVSLAFQSLVRSLAKSSTLA